MPTLQEEYDVLAGELRGLNVRLDLPEDDGIPQASPANSEYENLVQQNNALDQRLSALFPTFDEWNAEQDKLDKRSNWEATKTFADNFITGAGALAEEGAKAVKEVATGKAGWDSLGGIWEVGKRDFVRFAKTLGGAAEDLLPTTESERSREYRRAKENFDYYQTVRPLMVDAVGGDAKNLVSFGGQFVDPFMAFPVAGVAAKAGAVGLKSARLGRAAAALDKVGEVVSLPSKAVAAATRKGLKRTAYVAGKSAGLVGAAGGGVAKLAGLPRELTTKLAKKVLPEAASEGAGGALFASQIVGGASGMLPGAAELGIGEVAGFIASRTGKGLETVLTTLAAPGAQQRFLQRLAQTAESPRMRRLALIAHRKGLTKAGDVAFNSLVNGASIASINGALAYLSGESAEGIGQAAGAGMVMGGAMPFGQPGQKAGKAQSSRDATSINYLEGKLASEQVKEFRKLEPEARLVAATAEEAGIPIPKLFFVDSKMFLDLMRQDDPNAREAQSAMYDPKDKTIYVNQDISSKSSSRAVMQMFTEELGHHFITEAIKTDPMFGHQILAEYKAKPGEKSHTFIFERDPDGNPLRTIEINEKGKKLADAYSSISDDVNVGIENNANTLAQELGAAQFSIMMDENPNLFPHLAQPIRHKLVNASQKILSLMGITDKFGNTLPLNIASKLKRSPAIRNLYRNYLKQREMHMAGKIDLAEKGQSIPLKRGESPEAGAERLFGATGLSLKDAKAFVINNRQIKRELTKLKNQYQDAPADGWSVVRDRLIGKELTPDMRAILTRTNPDPRGSVNIIINDVQAAIADNSEVNFLFRSGKPSKYSDNELKVRVVAPVGLEFSGMAGKGAAGLYMQGMDIAYLKNNVEVLVQEGFIKDPDKFIAEARQVAKDAVSDPKGRINPKGKFENELITVALGNKASADFIKNPKLARLLEEGRLQHSFRQYHIGSLAGIALTGRPGIGFDWYNVKRNYSPHGRNFMPRRKPGQPDDTIPLPFDELPGDKPGEGFGRMINVDKTKSEMAEAKRLADEAQDGFSSSGNVRTPDAYGRDKLYMPAAYHGTPHTFKAEEGAPLGRFRSAQIGTGEGAQAYGHGLYFAGKKEVGEHYRKALTRGHPDDVYKEILRTSSKEGTGLSAPEASWMEWALNLDMESKDITRMFYEQFPEWKLVKDGGESQKGIEKLIIDVRKNLERGSLYKVELAPKENEYLLWDKPLSEQPKGVREKIHTILVEDPTFASEKPTLERYMEVYNGRDFYQHRRVKHDDPSLGGAAASAALREAGIPGIKYLDGSSRSKGKGDYNYVIFDEADVAITDKLFMPAAKPESVSPNTVEALSDANLRALEGDKKAVQTTLSIKDYTPNPDPESVALTARAGIVNPNISGMPKTYQGVRDLVTRVVDKVVHMATTYPTFAKRTASFYSDMARTAVNMADVVKHRTRNLFDVADLQLRFLALGSPRSAVAANQTKSSRSIMAAHGHTAGHKINPGDQQAGANRTTKDWDAGKHFDVLDEKALGADDKVRNFYLNGLAELIEVARVDGAAKDVAMLQDRAARTLGLIKGKQKLTSKKTAELERLLEGLATVDMWDMAGKEYAHPAYVLKGKGRGTNQDTAFHWSIPKHRVRATMKTGSTAHWSKALRELGKSSPEELSFREANALQIDGKKNWNENTWTSRIEKGFNSETEWSYYTKADEGGLTPGGGGPLYDAHQTIDGLIADRLNGLGLATFFGKKKLFARNAQEIIWALTKFENPLPANQKLVLFGDRFAEFHTAIENLRRTGVVDSKLPASARSIFAAIDDTYAKTATQSIPFEVVSQGKSPEAIASQKAETAMGAEDFTSSVAENLGKELQDIIDFHGEDVSIESVKVGRGGYTEDGKVAVSPNIVVALRGEPAITKQIMVEISRAGDQAEGNVIRKPTLQDLNSGRRLNDALTFDTSNLTPKEQAAFFLDLNKLKDAKGERFLTGYTETADGMFIGDQYYGGDMAAEISKQMPAIEAIRKRHNAGNWKLDEVVVDAFKRPDKVPFWNVDRTSFSRDVNDLIRQKISTAQGRKHTGLPQVTDRIQRIVDRADKMGRREYESAGKREEALVELQSEVDLAALDGLIDKAEKGDLKETVKSSFSNATIKGPFAPTRRAIQKGIESRLGDKKTTAKQKKNLLWSRRPKGDFGPGGKELTPGAFEKRAKGLMTQGQKSADLLPSSFRAKSGVKLPRSFSKPSQTGRIK